MSKRILVTGANGQLGSEIRARVMEYKDETQNQYFFTDRKELDITDASAVEAFVSMYHIDTIINCAAYTAVDKAEEESALAYRINRDAAETLARTAKTSGAWLIHISTDYVFDGTACRPLKETDPVDPQGVYGRSKLEGEEVIRRIAPEGALIIRTSWVYSSMGQNFVKTMLRLGNEREKIGVVYDQIGTPTYAADLAAAILFIMDAGKRDEGVDTLHYSNEGVCSWYDFAHSIFEMRQLECTIDPIATEAYPTPAKRPPYSVLDKSKIKEKYGIAIPYWRDSLKTCLDKMAL